jgi:predicted Fe-Mo cluster-binding NifX family protein
VGAARGAGIQTAQNAINAGVKAVISGHLGPNAFHVLTAAGIEVFTATNMTVREALDSYKKGELPRLTGADVDGHW